MSLRGLVIAGLVIWMPSIASNADAESAREPFFSTKFANEVFPEEILASDNPGFEYFLPIRKSSDALPAEGEQLNNPHEQRLTPEQIIAKYGDPNESEKIKPAENAPRPYKGIIEAWESGHRDLAFKYARKYARYVRDVRENAKRMTGLTAMAYEREGLLDGKGWSASPEFRQDEDLLKKDIEEAKLTQNDEPSFEQLPQEIKDYLNKEDQDIPAGQTSSLASTESQSVASLPTDSIPVDPKGEVKVLFFFKLNEADSLTMAGKLKELAALSNSDTRVRFMGYSTEMVSANDLKLFKQKTGLTFEVSIGVALAEKLGVKNTPSTIFVAENTDEAVVLTGAKDTEYLVKLKALMQGERK